MSRATLTQLRQLGLDSYALSQMDDADLQVCLDAAQAKIDTAIRSQFTLPILVPYPMDLIECECVLASWTALMVRGYNPASGVDSNINKRFQEWQDWLDQVSKGELFPVIVDSGDTTSFGATGPAVISATTRGYSERGISPNYPPNPQDDPFSSD